MEGKTGQSPKTWKLDNTIKQSMSQRRNHKGNLKLFGEEWT